ncbi:uncharacterized protein C6orf136 homolog [Sitophilus oryzae]|uniref:Uncharacterized protein C6orf136 homolog n=1 Tax=Sitophilus oryzae TaxID=7048 RepID=A0A6J2Y5N7_SITOR|nr:uncharacterized protein C6orf136 homolog [Sitophilus oryzae]
MAVTLRYFHKISGYLSITKPFPHIQQKFLTNQCEQYSRTTIQPQYKPLQVTHTDSGEHKEWIDNRELVTDIVTKSFVYRPLYFEKSSFDSTCLKCTEQSTNTIKASAPTDSTPQGRPAPEKLEKVYQVLAKNLPNLFVETLDYNIYDKNIIFEDHIRNIRTEGLMNYVRQVALLRLIGHIRFAYVKFEILKITQHPEDGTVKVRWRIKGLSAFQVMFQFWKYKVWEYKNILNRTENWYDGFSTFYVNADGLVVKHVADKMMPDSDSITSTTPPSGLGAAKLACVLGIIPQYPGMSFFM